MAIAHRALTGLATSLALVLLAAPLSPAVGADEVPAGTTAEPAGTTAEPAETTAEPAETTAEPAEPEAEAPAAPSRRPARPARAAAANVDGCAALPLTPWHQAPTVSAVRGEDPDTSECFAFTTGPSGAYAPRLLPKSANWSPYLTISEADGDHVWSGWVYATTFSVLQLKGAATYRVDVAGSTSTQPGDYRLGMYDVLGDAGGCDALDSLAWDSVETSASVTDGAVDCREFVATAGHTVRVSGRAVGAGSQHRVVNAAGTEICSTEGWALPRGCELVGAGPYRLLSITGSTDAEAALRLSVIDVDSDAGCLPAGAATWGAPLPTLGTRTADGSGLECYAFTAPHAGRYALRSSFESDRWSSSTEMWEAGTGDRLVNTTGAQDLTDLDLRAGRGYRVVVHGDPDGYDRGYAFGVFDVTRQDGCRTVPGLDWSSAPHEVAVEDGAVDCGSFATPAGTTLRLQSDRTSPEGQVWSTVYNAAGTRVCEVRTGQAEACTVSGAGPYRVLSRADDARNPAATELRAASVRSTEGCATVPLGVFGAPLPGAGERRADGRAAECFVVTSASASSYVLRPWFASASWSPRVEIWDGQTRIWDSTSWSLSSYLHQLPLRSSGSHRVVVSGNPDGYPAAYRLGLYEVRGATGCSPVTDLTWDAPMLTGSTSEGRLDCREVVAPAGTETWLELDRTGELGSPSATLLNRAGDVLCEVSGGQGARCRLSGAAPFRLVVRDHDPREEMSWQARISDVSTNEGCRDVGTATTATGAPVTGTVDPADGATCLGLPAAPSTTLLAALRGAGTSGRVVNGDAEQVCGFSSTYDPGTSCPLSGPGPFRVLLRADGDEPRDFAVLLRYPTADESCTAIPTIAYGFDPISGKLLDDLDHRCFTFDATTGDHLRISRTGLEGNLAPDLFVYSPNGDLLCQASSRWWWSSVADCTASRTGKHVAIAVADGSSAGRFRLSGECVNPACGPDELTVLGATPRDLGQSPSVTVTVQGKNLDVGHAIELYRGETVVEGRMVDVAEDRRTARALFDLSGAGLGAWNIRVAAADGGVATFPNAVTVVGAGDPEITAELTGLGRFVPGRTQTVSVSISNTGNIDGVGVPVILDGFPAGTTLEPTFEVQKLDVEGNPSPATIDPTEDMFVNDDGTTGLPLFINRMPAGSTIDASFKVTAVEASNFALTVDVGQCWVTGATDPGQGLRGRGKQVGPPGFECANAMTNTMVDLAFENLPGAACVSLARDLTQTGIRNWSERGNPFSFGGWGDVLSNSVSTAFSGLSCAADVFPATKALKVAVNTAKAANRVWTAGSLGLTCFDDLASLPYEAVASLDPNEMVGPAGGGEARAIRGEGRQHYAVYFENSKDATAPAQVVTIDSDLDAAKFDMESLTFGGISFGTTIWRPSEGSTSLDHTLDLVSDEGLQLRITATKDDDGTLQWLMETLDPATGELPEDPFLGFLPPNHDGTEGQGVVYFDVAYTDAVTNGDVVTATADIVFDLNPPIVTNTWSNVVDRDAPTATVLELPGTTGASSFPVVWQAGDSTSAVTEVLVYAATDGGSYELWQAADGSGSDTFVGEPGRDYAFAAVARDGAGNQSALPSVPHATTSVLLGTVTFVTAPVVTGRYAVGSALRLTVPATTPAGSATSVRWTRDGKNIPGADGTTYLLTPADVGRTVGAVVTATRADYAGAVTTLAGQRVAPGTIVRSGPPFKATGKAKKGKKLTAVIGAGQVTPATAKVGYQWYRGSRPIGGATGTTYKVGKKDVRQKLSCWATITAPGYSPLVLKTKTVKVGK